MISQCRGSVSGSVSVGKSQVFEINMRNLEHLEMKCKGQTLQGLEARTPRGIATATENASVYLRNHLLNPVGRVELCV